MRCAIAAAFLLLSVVPEEVKAQSFLLQSPVFAQFSVRTSVSVPDRGGALLGGISSAADSTKSVGRFPGSSMGRAISHRTISSHVYITDFNELDPFLRHQRQRQQVMIDPVKEKHERQSRAALAYQKMADKAEKKGKYDLAKWYRQKAREYSAKTKNP
ncbi:MAG: hypothetical protein AB8G99_04435 [Planctomycetaceae bacterium]